MKSYKRKEYISILILLHTSVTLCNPCVNQTLNAIPYPNDCQTFILCWLSHAYLQTCPNGLFFDIKTNNCQPLVTATCCNMTLPIFIIPVPIYQISTPPPINKTNIWPATYTTTQQTNSNSKIPLLPTLKPNSTFITSRNQPEATTSIMSTLWTESSDSSQSSELTLHVTERTEITMRLKPASVDMNVTESTKSVNSSLLNVYATSSITSTEFYNIKPNSPLIVSTDISDTTTPIQFKLWNSIRQTSLSEFTLNTTEQTEIVITTPTTSAYVFDLTKSEVSKQTETQTYVPTSPAFVTSTESSKKMPTSILMTPTNPSQLTMPIIFTLWSDSTDSSETSSTTDYNLNVTEKTVLPTTPLKTSRKYITTTKFIESSQPNVYKNPTIVSSTDSNINNPNTIASNPPEAITSIISTRWTDLNGTSQSYFTPGFNLNVTDSTKTKISSSQTTSIYNNLTNLTKSVQSNQPTTYTAFSIEPAKDLSSNKSSTTLLIPQKPPETTISIILTSWTQLSDSNQSLSSSGHTFTVTEQREAETTISLETNSVDINITKPVQSSKTSVYSISPIGSSKEYSNYTRLPTTTTTNMLSIATSNSTLNPLNTELYASGMTTITADTTISSKIFPSITSDSFGTDPQTVPETSQYYINNTFTTSLPTLTEHDTINSFTSSTKFFSNTFSTITAKSQIFTESSTLKPLVSSTTNILSSTKIPYFPTITPTIEPGEPSAITQYSVGNTSSKPTSYFKEAATQRRVLKTATEYIPTSITSSSSQFETSNKKIILSSMTISSNVSPTVTTDALQTESQIFTGNSTLIPIFSSATNIPYNSQSSSHLTLSSTTEIDGLSIIPQHSENSSPEFLNTSQDFFSTSKTFSKTELLTTTEHKLTAVISQSSPSKLISSTNAPKSETTVVLSSALDSREATNNLSIAPETTFVPLLTVDHFSSIIFTNTTNNTWHPVSVTLASSTSNLKSTTDYITTIQPVTTVSSTINSTSYPSELNVSDNSHLTSMLSTLLRFQPKITETRKYDVESPSTTLEAFPTSLENKHRSAMIMEPSISNQQNNLQTDSGTYTIQFTAQEEFKSTHSSLSPNTMLFTGKSITSPTAKPIVTQTRTLPPVPYSPPPCVLATTTQKSTISLKTLPTIQPIVTSTYISSKTSTQPSLSKPVCGFWDKFAFPDGSDCKYYYKCLFGGIRKVSCRYGYEFNAYALKCMPHLEANCQRRKSSKEVLDFLYYVMKLNDLSASSPTEHQKNHVVSKMNMTKQSEISENMANDCRL